MNQPTPASTAAFQAFIYAAYFETECGAEGDQTFQTYMRPSGVVDLFNIGDGGGAQSDTMNYVGYVNLRGVWVETAAGSDSVPETYWGAATLVETVTVPA